jgi:hypothetical protein
LTPHAAAHLEDGQALDPWEDSMSRSILMPTVNYSVLGLPRAHFIEISDVAFLATVGSKRR